MSNRAFQPRAHPHSGDARRTRPRSDIRRYWPGRNRTHPNPRRDCCHCRPADKEGNGERQMATKPESALDKAHEVLNGTANLLTVAMHAAKEGESAGYDHLLGIVYEEIKHAMILIGDQRKVERGRQHETGALRINALVRTAARPDLPRRVPDPPWPVARSQEDRLRQPQSLRDCLLRARRTTSARSPASKMRRRSIAWRSA
jgi:hypothetical protein